LLSCLLVIYIGRKSRYFIEKRKIGGLGIFLVKEMMDEVSYEYADGQNILKLKKNL